MAGICAAVAAARNGANTVLIQDRSVPGGNASSEIRVCVNGARASVGGKEVVERETGIIEEILLENRFFNPRDSYHVWDHILYDFVTRQENLALMMNTRVTNAVMDGERIEKEYMRRRGIANLREGYWWIELGSNDDIIADQETNRHNLIGYLHGVWDYIKNSGEYPQAENLALNWVSSVPGRRESRRFIGDYILCQRDLVDRHHFDDAVAYGGWPIDEHCPGGILSPDLPPTWFHHHFGKVYQIPYRSLYSCRRTASLPCYLLGNQLVT